MSEQQPVGPKSKSKLPRAPFVIGGGVVGLLLIGALLYRHATAGVNHVALTSEPKLVTVTASRSSSFRSSRRYVGTIESWVMARVGPQFVSAYVDTVLVRPGVAVKHGDIIATLDCRNASATSDAVKMQARAVEAMQAAMANEASRVTTLLDGGFVSPNEVEQKQADSTSKQAQMLALKAQMMGSALQVSDCILRAPFDGEVAERQVDPGAFVRPGMAIATVVDRSTVRVTADVPEADFDAVIPGTPVKIHSLATGRDLAVPISRRTPAADPGSRTVHIEIDYADKERTLPVGTTAEISLDVGQPQPATEIPLTAAVVRGEKANLYTVAMDIAHAATGTIIGERAGKLYLDPAFAAGQWVVIAGRNGLSEGNKVQAKEEPTGSDMASSQPPGHTNSSANTKEVVQ